MSVKITAEGDQVRVKSDRAGERAVSDVITRDELVAAVSALGYTVTPATDAPEPEAEGDAVAPAEEPA